MIAAIVSLCAAALAAPSGEIAFIAAPAAGPSRVHVLVLSTGRVRAIGPDNALGPVAWSPDGRRIAFAAFAPHGESRIFVADADSGRGSFLDHAQSYNRDPAWSPDGSQLAYTAGTGLDAQIMVASPDTHEERPWGGGRTSLATPVWTTLRVIDRFFRRVSDDDRPGFMPALAIAGSRRPVLVAVGFAGGATRTTDLFLLTESEATPLDAKLLPSPGLYEESAPSISRDGIAFDSNDGGDREVFVIGRRRTWDASNNAAADWRPLWSPDGRWMVFESFRGGTRGLYRLYKLSTRAVKLVSGPAADCWDAAWSPDSEWVAYTTNADGPPGVWAVRTDGTEGARVSPEGLPAGHAAWRPAP